MEENRIENEKEKFVNECTEYLCFDGYPVRIRAVGKDCLIWCKNTIGLYSQMDDFLNQRKKFANYYPWGVREKDRSEIVDSTDPNRIRIACLEGTRDETDKIMSACRRMMKENERKGRK